MATTKQIQQQIASYLPTWFAEAAAVGFEVPIDNNHIKGYLTTPDEQSTASPNWCILGGVHTLPVSYVLGDTNEHSRFVLLLFSRLESGQNAEASREAAEWWLTDAEEMLVRNLANLGPLAGYWSHIEVDTPQRDRNRQFWGKYRTSQIPFKVEK